MTRSALLLKYCKGFRQKICCSNRKHYLRSFQTLLRNSPFSIKSILTSVNARPQRNLVRFVSIYNLSTDISLLPQCIYCIYYFWLKPDQSWNTNFGRWNTTKHDNLFEGNFGNFFFEQEICGYKRQLRKFGLHMMSPNVDIIAQCSFCRISGAIFV